MNNSGRLGIAAEAQRNQVEHALFNLVVCENLLEEIELRAKQAIQRTPLVSGVLNPALERIVTVRMQVSSIKAVMAQLWSDGQGRRWNENKNDQF